MRMDQKERGVERREEKRVCLFVCTGVVVCVC